MDYCTGRFPDAQLIIPDGGCNEQGTPQAEKHAAGCGLDIDLGNLQAPECNGFRDMFTSDVLCMVKVGNGA